MGMQMPPTGPNMSPIGYQTHGMPPNVSDILDFGTESTFHYLAI